MVHGNSRVYGNAMVNGNSNVCGDALVEKSDHYLTVGGIGSRQDTTTFFRTQSKEIKVRCGCFLGTIEEF